MRSLQRVRPAIAGWIVLLLATLPGAGRAQRVLDLPLRTTAGADALASGPLAVFWNPAAIRVASARGEVTVVDVRGPQETGLAAFAVAGTWDLDPRTTLAVGFQHVGIDDIEETTTSPLPASGGSSLIEVAENVFAVAATHRAGEAVAIGAGVQYVRTAAALGGEDAVEIGAGAIVRPALPLSPRVGAAARIDDEGATWNAGIELAPAAARAGGWVFRGAWGAGGSPRFHGIAHRVSAAADWTDRVSVSAGIAGEPGAAGRTWEPVASASLRLTRYTVSVLREDLPNGFGAVHAFRLSVAF